MKSTEKYFEYLDALRESGVTNMLGAGIYLQKEFGLTRDESHKVLSLWIKSFTERSQTEA